MTCRYGHKRVALLFTLVQATAAARVIEWPKKLILNGEQRNRVSNGSNKSQADTTETSYANK